MPEHRIFVYGTLRRGESNAHLMDGARFVRDAQTPPAFTLFALDGHPGMGPDGHDAVHGEVYDVDELTLARLDRLEAHPTWYERLPITLADGEVVETYILPPRFTAGCPVISSGDWVAWRSNVP